MTSKPGAKHPLRETIQKTPAKELHLTLLVPQTPSPFFQPYLLPPPYYPPYLNNTPQYPQYASPYMYPPPGNPHKEIPQGTRQRSSSLPSEYGDLMDKLEEYFLWLTKIAPGMKEQLNEYLALLQKKDIVFDTLPSVTDTHYTRWENEGDKKVSDGVKLLVSSHLKKWKRAKAKGRA
jgi:hypothetical protein